MVGDRLSARGGRRLRHHGAKTHRRRRACTPVQYAPDRRDPRRLDPGIRPAFGRALQSGRQSCLRLARRVAMVDGRDLCRGASIRRPRRRVGGAPHVRAAGMAVLDHPAHRSGTMVGGSCRDLGLLLTVFGCVSRRPESIPYAVGLYITAAYWFTASTSFANPAVTIARSLSDTFTGIAPAGVA